MLRGQAAICSLIIHFPNVYLVFDLFKVSFTQPVLLLFLKANVQLEANAGILESRPYINLNNNTLENPDKNLKMKTLGEMLSKSRN